MDNNKDQRRTHTPSPGHENHGVHVCHKCGWSFPNPHPSAKQRRAHKKICGTIQGYKLAISQEQTHFNGSDDERVSGLVVSGSNNEKGNDGSVEKIIRSEDDVFSDAVADFPDNGQNQGVKDCLQQDGLNLGTDVERVYTKEQRLSGSSEFSDFNNASHLTVKSSSGCHITSPKVSQSENVEVENIIGLQGQLSVSTMDSFRSSVADLKTEESSFVHGDDFSGLSSDSSPSNAEATPEKNIYAGENVTDISLICVEKESNLKGKDEVKSEKDTVEFMDSSDNIFGETCEGVSKIAVSDAVSLDHEVGDDAITPKEKKGLECISLPPQDEVSLELNSSIITNKSQVESAHVIPFTSSDVKVLLEMEGGNVNIDTFHMHADTFDVAYPQSESLKHAKNVNGENNFHLNTSQLSEASDVVSSGMHLMDGMKMETEDIYDEDCVEDSPVKLTFETYQRSHEIGESMKTGVNENNFSENPKPGDAHQNSQFEGSFMVTSNESRRDASFGFVTSETTNIDNSNLHVVSTNEIDDAAVDGKDVGSNVESDFEIILKNFQPGDRLQPEVELSNDLFKNENDDADEIKIEKSEINDSQCKQFLTEMDASMPTSTLSPVISDVVIGGSARKSNGNECTKMDPVSDINEDEINSVKLHQEHKTSIGTSSDSHEAQDELVNSAEDLSSQKINTKPFSDSSVKDNTGGEPDREVSGISAAPVHGQNGNNSVKIGSSGIDASVDSGSRYDSLESNWGSVSVLSMQSDAPAVTDAETLLPAVLLLSKQAGRSNLNAPRTASDREAGKSEMFEPPSFTTLVESSHVNSPKGWFPTVNQVMNESQGRKSDEEIIAKVTNWSNSKEHTPLKSLLSETIHSNKPKSPKMEENSVNQKSVNKFPESNGSSGLTTVNSILGPESPSAQVTKVKEDAANEWNSPARYPAEIKREKRKLKSRPFWIQWVCCSTMDHQRR